MILIVSQYSDFATSQVINWLQYFGKKFIRINGDGNYRFLEISQNRLVIKMNGKLYNLLDCNNYWYRRDGISSWNLNTNIDYILHKSKLLQFMRHPIKQEINVIKSHIYNQIEEKIGYQNCVGRFVNRSVNKLDVLQKARKIGLLVPQSVILTSKQQIKPLLNDYNLVTKATSESIYDSDDNYRYISYTTEIDLEESTSLPPEFMASLFQEKIDKKFELRIFYLKGKFYPSVIFSQESNDGKIDCRRNSNCRYLPYNLPKDIADKLHVLMKSIKQKTGSIDMVVDKNNNYIFLEVNPVGQFVAYGEFCNYYLDREMAKIL